MPTLWTHEKTFAYRQFAKKFIATYDKEIDCADLALASLVEFAYDHKLPVRLKYYEGGWKYYESAREPSKEAFRKLVMRNMGALNVIDNSRSISLEEAGPGDLIMTKWDSRLGHTRIIYEIGKASPAPDATEYRVVWFQGNLPPVVPQRREALFSAIQNVFGNKPRRWSFDSFEKG